MIQKTANETTFVPALADFIEQTGRNVPNTDSALRDDLLRPIERLFTQGDYWSLDAVRRVLHQLAEDEPERGFGLLFAIEDALIATPREERLVSVFRRSFREK